MRFLPILLAIAAVLLLVFTTNVIANNARPETRSSDLVEKELSLPMELDMDIYDPYDESMTLIVHPNGFLYHLYSDTSSYGPDVLWLDVRNQSGPVFSIRIDLSSIGDFSSPYAAHYITADGVVYVAAIVRESRAYYGYSNQLTMLTIDPSMNATGPSVSSAYIGSCDGEPERVHFIQDGGLIGLVLEYENDLENFIVTTSPLNYTEVSYTMNKVIDSMAPPRSYGTCGGNFFHFEQIDGVVWATIYNISFTEVEEKELFKLETPVGEDNFFEAVSFDDEIYLFRSMDELTDGVYSHLDVDLIESSGNRTAIHSSVLTDHGKMINIHVIEDGFYTFDNSADRFVFLDRSLDTAWVSTETEEDTTITGSLTMIKDDGSIYFMYRYRSRYVVRTILESESYKFLNGNKIDQDLVFKDTELYLNGFLTIEWNASVLLINTTIRQGVFPYFGVDTGTIYIYNYGEFIFQNSALIERSSTYSAGINLKNYGRLVINNSNLDHVSILSLDELVVEGSETVLDPNVLEIDGKLYIKDLNMSKINWWSYYSSSLFETSVNTICVVEDCYIDNSDEFIGHSKNITYINCVFRNIFNENDKATTLSFIGCTFFDCTDNYDTTGQMLLFDDCTFISSRLELQTRTKITDSLFENSTSAVRIWTDETILIENNEFRGNVLAITTNSHYPTIRGNRFIDNDKSIDIEFRVDFSQYNYNEPNVNLNPSQSIFLDARYNHFDSSDPEEVYQELEPGIYFLPYYTLDGTEISSDDNDLDLIADDWETANGMDPNDYFDRYYDPDFDHYSNYEEYKEGTDPNDKESTPANRTRIQITLVLTILGIILLLITVYVFYGRSAIRRHQQKKIADGYAEYANSLASKSKKEEVTKDEPKEKPKKKKGGKKKGKKGTKKKKSPKDDVPEEETQDPIEEVAPEQEVPEQQEVPDDEAPVQEQELTEETLDEEVPTDDIPDVQEDVTPDETALPDEEVVQ